MLTRTVGAPNVMRVLTRMGIPVFLNATAPHPEPRIEGPKLDHDHFDLSPAACAAARLQMKVVSDAATVDTTFAIPAGTCKP